MKTELWNGNAIRFVEALGYEPTLLATEHDPIVDRLALMDGRFILTESRRILYETDVFGSDTANKVIYPNVAVEVENYLAQLGKHNAAKFLDAINDGLLTLTRASFPACHPSDVSELAARIADVSGFDEFVTSQEYVPSTSSKRCVEAGYVYFLKAENGLTKIGCTNDVEKRMRAISTMSPERLQLIGVIKTNHKYKLESKLHDKYDNKRKHGEWFSLSDSELVAAKRNFDLDFKVSTVIYKKYSQEV